MDITLTPFKENLDTILEYYKYYSMTVPEKRRFKNLIIKLNQDEFLSNINGNTAEESGQFSRSAKFNEILDVITKDIQKCEVSEHRRGEHNLKIGSKELLGGWR